MNHKNLQTLLRKYSGVGPVLGEITAEDVESAPPEVRQEMIAVLRDLLDGVTHALTIVDRGSGGE